MDHSHEMNWGRRDTTVIVEKTTTYIHTAGLSKISRILGQKVMHEFVITLLNEVFDILFLAFIRFRTLHGHMC